MFKVRLCPSQKAPDPNLQARQNNFPAARKGCHRFKLLTGLFPSLFFSSSKTRATPGLSGSKVGCPTVTTQPISPAGSRISRGVFCFVFSLPCTTTSVEMRAALSDNFRFPHLYLAPSGAVGSRKGEKEAGP